MLVMTPPMGYNTWNTFGYDINADLIKETADAMVREGLLEAGDKYLVIDDCWSELERDPKTDKIIPDHIKFPKGMKDVSDYVHSKGLKFGMYSCAGVRTCADFPGSFDHEFLDAQTFAEYGCDFLKYDFCHCPQNIDGRLLYRRMGVALRNCGREILYSACNWGVDNSGSWMRATGADMYRSTGDIIDNFKSFSDILLSQQHNVGYSGPCCFNDLDMLTVGMYGKGNVGSSGCNDIDYKTQFALWCMFGSPLMIGCDVRHMTPEAKALLTNKNLIALNQDPDCCPPYEVASNRWNSRMKSFIRHLSNNEFAIGFFNMADEADGIPFFSFNAGLDVSCDYGFALTDMFTGEDAGLLEEFTYPVIQAHDCALYRAKIVKL